MGLEKLPGRNVDAQSRGAWPLRTYNDYRLALKQLDLRRRTLWKATDDEKEVAEAGYTSGLELLLNFAETLQQVSNVPRKDLLSDELIEDMQSRGVID
jgi:hypothetical protein